MKLVTLGDIVILHMYTKNCNQMMYGSGTGLDMVPGGQTDGHTEKVTYKFGCPPKNHTENVCQKPVPDPIILLSNPKQPLHTINYFKNKKF